MSPNGLFSRQEIQQLAEEFPQYCAELQRCVEQLSKENAEQDHLVAAVRKS